MTIVFLLLAVLALMVAMVIVRNVNEQRQQVRVPVRIQRPRSTRR